MSVAVLRTERLVLRGHRPDDLDDYAALWADPAVCRHTIGEPSTRQRTWIRLLSHLGHWSALGFGYWAVEERASGRLVGELGFADFKRGLDARLEGVPEAGWALAQHAHGKGYATEALGAALAWADARLGPRTVCIVHADNHASLRLAAKMRYLAFDRVTAGGREDLLLARDAPTG